MRRFATLIVATSVLIFLNTNASHAITIGFQPIAQDVLVGNPASVDLTISGLGDHTAPSLGTFDLDIFFNPAILGFSSVAFGDPTLGDQLDLFGLGSVKSYDTSTPGKVNLFELSLDSATDLDTLQAGSFVLASLTFNTLAMGTSPLGISINALGDSTGSALTADIQSGNITAVPEPGTLLLLSSGIAVLVFLRKIPRPFKI